MKIAQKFSKLLSGHYFQTEIFKGHNSLKNVGRVMVLNLCTSSYDALYLVYNRADMTFIGKISKGYNSVFLCTSSDDGLYLYKVS